MRIARRLQDAEIHRDSYAFVHGTQNFTQIQSREKKKNTNHLDVEWKSPQTHALTNVPLLVDAGRVVFDLFPLYCDPVLADAPHLGHRQTRLDVARHGGRVELGWTDDWLFGRGGA